MRPKKYFKPRYLTICIDDKDMEYLDDRRGKMTRGDYFTEAMYALRPEQSDKLRESAEKIKAQAAEIHELKKQLLFERTRGGRAGYKSVQAGYEDAADLVCFYEEKDLGALISSQTSRNSINWENLYNRNIERLAAYVKDGKGLKSWCMSYFRSNGAEKQQ